MHETNKPDRSLHRLLRLARRAASWLAAGAMLAVTAAHADAPLSSPAQAELKLSPDLDQALTAPSVASLNWARDTAAGRMMKVLVMGYSTSDPDLKSLRSAIVSSGGSVYYKYISVEGLYALLPAARVIDIARRQDVQSISPNRLTVRTRSLIESVTGSYEARGAGAVVSPGVDGSGVGIAFLDSGIMPSHQAFLGDNGLSRVKRSVDFQKLSDAQLLGPLDWVGGYDLSKQIFPGSAGELAL